MPISYDIEKDALYQKGFEKGFKLGFEKGLKIARKRFILALHKEKISASTIAHILSISQEEVKAITEGGEAEQSSE